MYPQSHKHDVLCTTASVFLLHVHYAHIMSDWLLDLYCCLDAVFLVPSVFCIGRTGQVLMPMNGAQTASQLKEKLRDAFHVSIHFIWGRKSVCEIQNLVNVLY